ncbi:MAG: UDP-N-acetylglucosamine-peptide N-acetylglucosaminyltransferase [Alphaproteobacteria bacterium]
MKGLNLKQEKFDRVMALIRAGSLDEAHGLLDGFRRHEPNELNFLGLAAWLAGLRGDNMRSLALYRRIVARAPDNREARFNMHRAESIEAERAGDPRAALDAMLAAQAMMPKDETAAAQIALLKRQLCDFTPSAIPSGLMSPAAAMVLRPSPAAQLANASSWAKRLEPPPQAAHPSLLLSPARKPGSPLRLGFLSSDFHRHATAYLCAELFELLDRKDFSVHAYSYGVDDGSDIRQRIASACDAFVDLNGLGAHEAARRIREDGIDILIDLKGYTRGGRPDIPAYRPASLQMHWLGFPGTLGCDFIDYFIADRIALPPSLAAHFSEKILYLPDSYQINDRRRPLPEPRPRADYGLPEHTIVFASFNQTYKLAPELLTLWADILRDVPDSVLWLLAGNKEAPGNIRAFMAAQGIDETRLLFAEPLPLAEHLARYHHVDVALDTFPVGGHTTTSDALWIGAPAVSLPGESFVSRVGASLLAAAELPDLIAKDAADYRKLVVSLAQNPARRAQIRKHLAENRLRLPLFDTESFVKNFSAALLSAWTRHERGLPPENIGIVKESS